MVATSPTIVQLAAAGKVCRIGAHFEHGPHYHTFMKQKIRAAAKKVTIADVSPAGVVLHFDSGISVHYSSEFLWRNREVSGNKILPEPPPDEDE